MIVRPLAAFALATLSIFSAVSPALAGGIEPTGRTAYIKLGDLDLTSEAGQQKLQHRVRYAVKNVCSTGSADLASRAEARACSDTTMERTMPEVKRLIAAAETSKAQYAMVQADR